MAVARIRWTDVGGKMLPRVIETPIGRSRATRRSPPEVVPMTPQGLEPSSGIARTPPIVPAPAPAVAVMVFGPASSASGQRVGYPRGSRNFMRGYSPNRTQRATKGGWNGAYGATIVSRPKA